MVKFWYDGKESANYVQYFDFKILQNYICFKKIFENLDAINIDISTVPIISIYARSFGAQGGAGVSPEN